MKYKVASGIGKIGDDLEKLISKTLTEYSRQLYGYSKKEFDRFVDCDFIRILSFYCSRMDSENKEVLCNILEDKFKVKDVERMLDNQENGLEYNYVPISCMLLDKLGDSRITRIIYESLFMECCETINNNWDRQNSCSNYLVLLNAAYFKGVSYKLHCVESYRKCLGKYYNSYDFSELVEKLYKENKLGWDVDVDLPFIEHEIQVAKQKREVGEISRQTYTDALSFMEQISLAALSDLPAQRATGGFKRIVERTKIKEYLVKNIYGFECHFCKARRTEDEYIIVYQREKQIADIVDNEEEWSKFQHDVYYADIEAGKSAGMVYILYILDEKSKNIPIQVIESNKTYGRKYVFTENETITFINGIVKTTSEEVEATSPVQVWDGILREEHLTGCLTEFYSKKKVDAYLAGERLDADYVQDDDYKALTTSHIPTIKWVKSLNTKGFRDFCFDDKVMEFGQINLFHGANGSGKTSVLEAIEYALTSEVRRVNDFKVKMPSGLTPELSVYDRQAGIYKFNPYFSKFNNKEIERVWYGVPIGRTKCNLNENFNRFNAFDSEAAYKFIHESDNSQDSYSTMFGNLIFGETIVDHEKKWQRFKKAFDERYSELRTELNEAKAMIPLYEDSIAEKMNNTKSVRLEEILRRLHYRKYMRLPEQSEERYKRLLDDLGLIRKYVDIIDGGYEEDVTFEEIRGYIAEKKETGLQKAKKRRQLNEEIAALTKGIREEREKIYDAQDRQAKEKELLNQLEVETQNWKIVQNVMENKTTLQLVQNLSEELLHIEKDLFDITKIERRTALVNFLCLDSYDGLSIDELEDITFEYEELKDEKRILENEYKEEKEHYDDREQKIIELRKLGKTLITDNKCPLCGHEYDSMDLLLETIDEVAVVDDKMAHLIAEIREISEQIKKIETQISREKLIARAHVELEEVQREIPELKEYDGDYREIRNYLESKVEKEIRKREILEQQEVLDRQGFSLDNIAKCKQYKNTNPTYLKFAESGTNSTYESYLSHNKAEVTSGYKKLQGIIDACEKTICDNERNIELAENSIKQIDQEVVTLNLNAYREQGQALENIASRFYLLGSMEKRQWIDQYRELYDNCELEVERISSNGELLFERRMLMEYKEKATKLEPMVMRCASAVQAFERMPSLSSLVDQQLSNKIDTISKLFTRMHHSHEFERLGIDNEGLYAIRMYNSEKIRIYQMSTGQRATIAMAVMFTLHISAKEAPQFLLLDEPLATMDDIQVKDVLDILEEMAQEGTQIFFTSANGIMIRLFKEHFRDTKYDYKEYQFIKRVNMPSEIKETSINDTKTIEELSLDDLTLDFNQFAEIRRILRKNQERLVAKEEWEQIEKDIPTAENNLLTGATVVPESEETDNFIFTLTAEEKELLHIVLYTDTSNTRYLKEALEPYPAFRTIYERVNEKAIDFYGETVVENNDSLPWVGSDYHEELCRQFEDFESNKE